MAGQVSSVSRVSWLRKTTGQSPLGVRRAVSRKRASPRSELATPSWVGGDAEVREVGGGEEVAEDAGRGEDREGELRLGLAEFGEEFGDGGRVGAEIGAGLAGVERADAED